MTKDFRITSANHGKVQNHTMTGGSLREVKKKMREDHPDNVIVAIKTVGKKKMSFYLKKR